MYLGIVVQVLCPRLMLAPQMSKLNLHLKCPNCLSFYFGMNEIVVSSEAHSVEDSVMGPSKFNFDIGDGLNQEQ